jgi:hypothetical protein
MPHGLAQKTLDRIAIAREILAAEQPLTVRGVAYRFFNRKLLPDMGKRSTDIASTFLTTAREREMIPWQWLVDETRPIEYVPSWDDPEQFLESVGEQYRVDRWASQPIRVFLVSEKGTVGGILRPVIKGCGVPFAVYHGFGSASAVNLMARISASDRRPLILLYAGDFDPSGRYMSDKDLPERLARYGGVATIERVALVESDLPGLAAAGLTFSAHEKKADSRYRWFLEEHGEVCAELDALDANELRRRVEAAILGHLDLDAWDRAGSTEEAEINSLREFFSAWKTEAA